MADVRGHIPVLLGLSGAPYEEGLVAELNKSPGPLRIERRCLDVADLLAAAAVGTSHVAVVTADLHRLDVDAMARLRASGTRVVGLAEISNPLQWQRLRAVGVHELLGVDPETGADVIVAGLSALVTASAEAAPTRPELAVVDGPERSDGHVVAVWGPVGAPGRTTVATVVADEMARLGAETLLVDCDTYGPAVAQTLGVLDEASGLAAAVRRGRDGGIDGDGLAACALALRPHLRVLTGVTRADRWPELSGPALSVVLRTASSVADIVVVDCGFCLEEDEELSFDTRAPRRNAATLVPLRLARTVVAVASADPVGLARIIRTLPELRDRAPDAKVRVVVNRVRTGVAGRGAERRIRDTLARHAGVTDAFLVPYDRNGIDAALIAGRALGDRAKASPTRAALIRLATQLVGDAQAEKSSSRPATV